MILLTSTTYTDKATGKHLRSMRCNAQFADLQALEAYRRSISPCVYPEFAYRETYGNHRRKNRYTDNHKTAKAWKRKI